MHRLTMQHKYALYNHLLMWCFLFSTPCADRHGIHVSRAYSDLAAWECHVVDNICIMCSTHSVVAGKNLCLRVYYISTAGNL